MGLLEKASNIEAEEKPPETKVVKPKKEAVKEPPAEKPKKAAKKPKKVKPPKQKKPKAPRIKKELPDGFEHATRGQKLIRRIGDFAINYGLIFATFVVSILIYGDYTYLYFIGLALFAFNLGFMPRYAGSRTFGNWVSRTKYINSRGNAPFQFYFVAKGFTFLFSLLGIVGLMIVLGELTGSGGSVKPWQVILILFSIPPMIDYGMYRFGRELGLWDTIFGGVWLVRTTKSKEAKGWLKRLESVSDWTESKGFLNEQESSE